MNYVLIHLITAVLLLLMTFWLLVAHSNKQISVIMFINRLLYILLIVTGIRLAFWTFSDHWFLTSLKLILALGLIGSVEVLGAHKIQASLTVKNIIPMLVLFILVFVVGFSLH